jgi:hypothetical protein
MNRLALVVGSCLLVLTLPTAARAACPLFSLEDQVAYRDAAVFTGRATSQRVIPSEAKAIGSMMTETTFEVEDVWKGDVGPVAQVRTCGYTLGNESMTCSEGVTFSIGTRYIIFASGNPLQTNGCFSTQRLDSVEGARISGSLADRPHHKPR